MIDRPLRGAYQYVKRIALLSSLTTNVSMSSSSTSITSVSFNFPNFMQLAIFMITFIILKTKLDEQGRLFELIRSVITYPFYLLLNSFNLQYRYQQLFVFSDSFSFSNFPIPESIGFIIIL
jgi:hypothetical protein